MSFAKVQKGAEKKIEQHIREGGLFVGSRMVVAHTIEEAVDVVGVLFEGDAFENYTIEQWEAVKSLEPYPDGEVSLRRFRKSIDEIGMLIVTAKDEEVVDEATGKTKKVTATTNAVKGALDVLMRERCDLNSFGWVLQQVQSMVQSTCQAVHRNVEDSYRLCVAKSFGVNAVEGIMLAQLHEELLSNADTMNEEETKTEEAVAAMTEETPSEDTAAAEPTAEAPAEDGVAAAPVETPAEAAPETAPAEEAPAEPVAA